MSNRYSNTSKKRLDKFYYLAKEQGYRARSAFKLIQLEKRFNILSSSKVVLDLCAAPGGWSQVAVKHCPVPSIIIAIDLDPIPPIKGVISLQEDITTQTCRAAIKRHLREWQVDTVLNDGAPNVGANWSKDAYSQAELTLHACKLAADFLRPGGNFITKVFRSSDYTALLWVFHQLFNRVEATKPLASRDTSAEIFVVCRGFKAPETIDPRLFDPKSVFADISEKTDALVTLFSKPHGRKQRPSRGGYAEEDVGRLPNAVKTPIEDFIFPENTPSSEQSKRAAEVILRSASFEFSSDLGKEIKSRISQEESFIIDFCEDLKVLNQVDLRTFLRWRKAFAAKHSEICPEDRRPLRPVKANQDEEEQADESDVEMEEMTFLEKLARSKEKRIRKKEERAREKMAERQRYNMIEDMTIGQEDDAELFSLKKWANFDPMSSSEEEDDVNTDSDEISSDEEHLREIEDHLLLQHRLSLSKKQLSQAEELKSVKKQIHKHGFEEVSVDESTKRKRKSSTLQGEEPETKAMALSDESEYSSDDDTDSDRLPAPGDADYDSDEAAEQLAIAKKLIRKSDRTDFIDDQYNRYSYGQEDLPEWFVADENKHVFKHKPVTKEEIQAMKEKLQEIDARPVKRVAEATARKKLQLNRKVDKIKSKAREIAGDASMTGAEKVKAITRAYRAVKGMIDRPERVYVSSKKFMQGTKHAGSIGKKRSRVRFVDARMRKDKNMNDAEVRNSVKPRTRKSKSKSRQRKRR
ncbi:hypothetical protein RCL1_004401 [Eukaryota sp. TZLM3-RCL]